MPFCLPARVLMADAPGLLAQGSLALRGGETIFDLGAVIECDSSLLACLNEWRRTAAGSGGVIQAINAPDALRRIARLYGVEALTLG